MNLPLKPLGGVCGEAGAVSIGVLGAASATISAEYSAWILHLRRELEECQAQCALYEAERAIMKRERDDARQALQCHLDAFRATGDANVRLQHELNDCRRLIAELEARK